MNRKLINKAALGIPVLLVTFGVAAVTLNAQEDPATKKPPLGQGKGPGGPGKGPGGPGPFGKGPGGPGKGPGRAPGGPGRSPGGPGKGPGPGFNPGLMVPPGKNKGVLGAGAPPAAVPVVHLVHHKGKDPFYIPWTVPPPPPYVFDKILPVRLADPEIEPPPVRQVTVREEPALRVSGIMTGDGVFAILEQSNKVDIVKPGSSVDIGGNGGGRTYKVVSIQDETVTLESIEGKITYQQIVPLSDAPLGTGQSTFGQGGGGLPGGRPPVGGGPGGPGSFGGRRGPGGGGPGSGRGKGD